MLPIQDRHLALIQLRWPGRTADGQVEKDAPLVEALVKSCETHLFDAALALAGFEASAAALMTIRPGWSLDVTASIRTRFLYARSFIMSLSAVHTACAKLKEAYGPRSKLSACLALNQKTFRAIKDLRDAIAHQEDRVRRMARGVPIPNLDNLFVNSDLHGDHYAQTLPNGKHLKLQLDFNLLACVRDLAQAAIDSVTWLPDPMTTP